MSHNFIPGIATQSLGGPECHGIHEKLIAAANVGLGSVEIFEEDLLNLCHLVQHDNHILEQKFTPNPAGHQFPESTEDDELRLSCARQIGAWCSSLSLDVICLQPFKNFDGLSDPQVRENRFRDLTLWLHLADCLGTDLIQIPSNFSPEDQCTGDRSQIIADLRRAADMGLSHTKPTRFAYEALCFGTNTDHWDAAFEIVQAVDRPNFGTCLDTFNLAGRVYADPSSPTGRTPNADRDIARSIQKIRDTFRDPANLQKLFYVELCDGERIAQPINEDHEWYNPEQKPRMTWSRNARLFPFETTDGAFGPDVGPGYLPVTAILDAILDVGYQGYISFEVFSRTLHREGHQVVLEHAERARVSWARCVEYIDQYLTGQEEKAQSVEQGRLLGLRGGAGESFAIQPRL